MLFVKFTDKSNILPTCTLCLISRMKKAEMNTARIGTGTEETC